MIRNVIGILLLIFGGLDIWKFGWSVLVHSPELILGIIMVFLGGLALKSGRPELP